MIGVVAGERAPVATVVPIRGAGRVTGHLARYNMYCRNKVCFVQKRDVHTFIHL